MQSAREPRDVLKTAGSQVGTILALGSTGKPTNLLLVRDDVGRPKPTCFDLPDNQFSYGRPGNQDSEGAREVSMRWVGHTRSKRMQADEPDFMSVNRKAAADRVTNAKDLRHYFQQAPDPPRLSGRSRNLGKPLIPSDVILGFAYGRKVRPSTPIQEVISARFAERAEHQLLDFYSEMKEVRDATRSQVRKIPFTTATRACRAARKAILEEDNPHWKQEPFKLSKFKRVRAKVTSFRQKSEAAEILELDIAAQMNEEEPRSKIENDKLPRDEDEPVEQ